MQTSPLFATTLWLCAATVLYAYALYPVMLYLLAAAFGRRTEPPTVRDAELPSVSLLIAAHNEETVIEERLRNALACDYPADRLEIVVASDGSTDATGRIVRRYASRGVRLLEDARRQGKAATLNSAVARLRGEIVFLSDANTHTDPAALRHMVRWFADAHVGVVCGRLALTDPDTGRNADSFYWRYETFLKRCEGRLGALLGANGAIYAIRRELYTAIPANTIIDDFVIPLTARLRKGCRIVYECEAVAREETAPDVQAEFRRRARIGAGGFQAIGLLWRLLDPRHGWVAFAFLSHKVLRWLCPFFLIGAFASSLVLTLSGGLHLGGYALLAQAAFYALSVLTACAPAGLKIPRWLRAAAMFSSMNAALLVGFGRWTRGRQTGMWERTVRSSPHYNTA